MAVIPSVGLTQIESISWVLAELIKAKFRMKDESLKLNAIIINILLLLGMDLLAPGVCYYPAK